MIKEVIALRYLREHIGYFVFINHICVSCYFFQHICWKLY